MEFWGRERVLRRAVDPGVALAMGAAWGTVLLVLSFVISGTLRGSALVFIPLVVAAYVDSVRHLLPDPLLLTAGACALLAGIADSTLGVSTFLAAGGGLVVGQLLSYISSLGRGDAKLLGVLGLWLGPAVVGAVAVAILGAGIYALLLMMTRRAGAQTAIALGPWLVAGGFCTFIAL
ncbi:MAG: prepilin peptidase [Ancrocorticia sp.]|uniref:prepilin peptidase n=1 Tax=Ancrocorticia sp. TaxID=2593684 RepID=UPI003F91ED03